MSVLLPALLPRFSILLRQGLMWSRLALNFWCSCLCPPQPSECWHLKICATLNSTTSSLILLILNLLTCFDSSSSFFPNTLSHQTEWLHQTAQLRAAGMSCSSSLICSSAVWPTDSMPSTVVGAEGAESEALSLCLTVYIVA